MKETLDFSQVPQHYPICLNPECPQADNCLRQLVAQCMPAEVQYWLTLNPKFLATQTDACIHFRPAVKVQLAKGFINILNDLPHKQMRKVIPQLIATFEQRTYYRLRKGERLLSPAEQQRFINTLRKCGVTSPLTFDAYVESYDW